MKRKYTTFDEAVAQYTQYTGDVPEAGKMIDLYHRYRNNWKSYNSFLEWMIYNE